MGSPSFWPLQTSQLFLLVILTKNINFTMGTVAKNPLLSTFKISLYRLNTSSRKTTMKNHLVLLCLSLGSSMPQYGGGGSLPSLQPPTHSSSVQCRTEQQTIWDTEYVETETQECETIQQKKCSTLYRSQCKPVNRQQCNTVYENECTTQYQQQCSTQYKDELEYYTETECNTDYKQDCEYRWEGSGNNKVWAPIPGSCNNNAYDKCGDVQKQKLKQVPYQDCQNVPQQQCRAVHKKVPQRISRTVPKRICDGGSGGSGYNGGSGGSGFNGGSGGSGFPRGSGSS